MATMKTYIVNRVVIEEKRIAVDLWEETDSIFTISRILLPKKAKRKIEVGDEIEIEYFSEGQIGDTILGVKVIREAKQKEIPVFSSRDPRARKKPPCWEDFIEILRLNRFKVCKYMEHQGMEPQDFYVEITVYHMDTTAISDITGKGKWEEDAIMEVLRKIERRKELL